MGIISSGLSTAKGLLRRAVPARMLKDRRIYQRLGANAGRIFLKMTLLDMAHVRRQHRKVPSSARSLVFVCFGNIMRSAMSEAIALRTLRELGRTDIQLQSAGLHAANGTAAHPWAQAAAEAQGLSLSNHAAKLLTKEMVLNADAILAMDYQNWAELLAQYPEAADRIFMLSAYCDPPWKNREIPDPYFGDEASTKACCSALEISVNRLLASLTPSK